MASSCWHFTHLGAAATWVAPHCGQNFEPLARGALHCTHGTVAGSSTTVGFPQLAQNFTPGVSGA